MASGVGVNGGRGRCYPLWLEFTRCVNDADKPSDCVDNREDYIECLHHKKEITRMVTVASEMERQNIAPHNPDAADPVALEPAKKK